MKVLNFTFHGIGEPPADVGDSERRVWVSRPDFHSALDFIAEHDHMRVTVDDGNQSDVEIVLPALLERGLSGSFFVVADRIGRPGYLDAADLHALRDAGMEVGLHGMKHRRWRHLSKRTLDEEMGEARHILETHLGAPIATAACPFGSYDRSSLSELRRGGFTRVFTSDGGYASTDWWLQPRTTLRAGSDVDVVERIAEHAGRPIAKLSRLKTLVKRNL